MMQQIAHIRLAIVGVLAITALFIWTPVASVSLEDEALLKVHFLDVGQGDSILIEAPSGKQVLIDGGPNSGVLQELSQYMSWDDRAIDIVVATHPDKDHIGGLIDVLERYDVAMLIQTDNKSESAVYESFTQQVAHENTEVIYARRGQRIALDASTTLSILFPETEAVAMESNESSIVLKLTYGDASFMLTGDSPKRIEEYLVLAEGEHLESTVLKVGHHGSRTSTSELFLEEVNPAYAVISAGKDSQYGHPHVEVTDMLFNHRVKTLSTAEVGAITFVSDGDEVWVK